MVAAYHALDGSHVTNADKALSLKKWVDEVMFLQTGITASSLVYNVNGERVYGLSGDSKAGMPINLKAMYASIQEDTRLSQIKKILAGGCYSKAVMGGRGGVSTH